MYIIYNYIYIYIYIFIHLHIALPGSTTKNVSTARGQAAFAVLRDPGYSIWAGDRVEHMNPYYYLSVCICIYIYTYTYMYVYIHI